MIARADGHLGIERRGDQHGAAHQIRVAAGELEGDGAAVPSTADNHRLANAFALRDGRDVVGMVAPGAGIFKHLRAPMTAPVHPQHTVRA